MVSQSFSDDGEMPPPVDINSPGPFPRGSGPSAKGKRRQAPRVMRVLLISSPFFLRLIQKDRPLIIGEVAAGHEPGARVFREKVPFPFF